MKQQSGYKRPAALVLALCAIATQSQAMDMGKIVIFSHLSEPLNASVQLGSANGGKEGDVVAQVASAEVYAASGIKRPAWVDQARIQVLGVDAGRLELKITTAAPIESPASSLILEVAFTGEGRLAMREYAIILDPTDLGKPEAPVLAKPKEPSPPAQSSGNVAANSKPQSQTGLAPAPVRVEPSDDKLVVKSGQILYGIAQVKKPSDVSVERMMIGMLKANPQAFVSDNINRLKSGAIMRMPSRPELDAIAQNDAVAEVNRQAVDFRQWRDAAVKNVAAIEPKPAGQSSGGKISSTQAAPDGDKDTLKLGKPAVGGSGQDKTDAIAKQKADQEAKDKLRELEKMKANLDKLMTLKDKNLAEAKKKEKEAEEKAAAAKAAVEKAAADKAAAEKAAADKSAAEKTAADKAAADKAAAAKAITDKLAADKAAAEKAAADKAAAAKLAADKVSADKLAADKAAADKAASEKADAEKVAAEKAASEKVAADKAAAEKAAAKPEVAETKPEVAETKPEEPKTVEPPKPVDTPKPPVKLVQKPVPPPPPPEPSIGDTLMDLLSQYGLLASAGLAAMLGGGAFLLRKRKSVKGPSTTTISPEFEPSSFPATKAEKPPAPTAFEERINSADTYIAFDQPEKAIDELEEALKLAPGHLDALIRLARISAKAEDLPNFTKFAEEIAETTSKIGPYWTEIESMLTHFPLAGKSALGSSSIEQIVPDIPVEMPESTWSEPEPEPVPVRRNVAPAPFVAPPPISIPAPAPPPAPAAPLVEANVADLSFELPGYELPAFVPDLDLPMDSTPKTGDPLKAEFGNMSFDMSLPDDVPDLRLDSTSQSLDFDAPVIKAPASMDSEMESELKTMLELAKAYLEMGDRDGSKELLSEIVEKGSPELVAQAKEMMAGIGK